MKKVLIISPQFDEQTELQKISDMHRPGAFKFETTASFGQDAVFWGSQAPDVLIIQLPEDDMLQGYYFTKLRKDVSKNQAIIFLCAVVSSPLMQLSMYFSKVRMLKSPVDGMAVYRSVVDLTQEYEDGKKQIHPRYQTEQNVEVRSDMHEGRVHGVMKNLSVTGAYFEIKEEMFPIKAGDFIRLSVFVGNPTKLYVFDVRVVWSAQKTPALKGFGCTFVDKDAVYNNLLRHI